MPEISPARAQILSKNDIFIEIIIAQILWTFKEFRLFPFIESDYFTIFVYW